MATHSTILPGNFHGQRSLAGRSPWVHKELDTTEHTHNVSVKSPCLLLNIIFLDVIVSEIEFFVSFWDCLCCYIQI